MSATIPKKISIPNAWAPRDYQMPLWAYLERGGKRAVAVWHRRGGKDSLSLNWTAVSCFQRKGLYWHMLPTQKQGRKVVWDSIDKQGRRVIDQVFPKETRVSTNQQEMRIELVNGSIWQVVGSDNYDSLVGANPVGVVFSEYSVANPAAWDFMRPILAENEGWAIFIYTPRGKNHGYHLYDMASGNPDWFAELLKLDESGAYPMTVVEDERRAGMREEMIEQEFFCSFDAAVIGAYYGKLLQQLDADKKITSVPWEPSIEVHTAWDLGIDDQTAIWFVQVLGSEIRVIDYYAASGHGLNHFAKVLKDKPYVYGTHYLPHDVKVREMSTGQSRLETLTKLGIRPFVVPRLTVEDGIQAVRNILPKCWFDREGTRIGREALSLYRAEYDERHQTTKTRPLHDWTSHAADAFRYLAVGLREHKLTPVHKPEMADMEYSPFHNYSSGGHRPYVTEDWSPFS